MAKTDLANNIAPIIHIPLDTYTADVTPGVSMGISVLDLQGYEGCTFIITTGDVGMDMGATYTFSFQESVDAAFTNPITLTGDNAYKLIGDIPGPLTTVMGAFDNKIYKVGYIGDKQFVRCNLTVAGMPMGGAALSVIVVLGDPHSAPVSVGFA
jgi:hypothetical protein